MTKTLRVGLMLVFLLLLGGGVVAAQKSASVPDAIPNPDTGPIEPAPVPLQPVASPAESESSPDPLQPSAPLADPILLVLDDNTSFTYGGGFLYWEHDCVGSVETLPIYLRRRGENGGVVQTLYEIVPSTHAQCESLSRYNVADDSGVFYVNYDQSRLEARLTSDPATANTIASLTDLSPVLVADDAYVYYNQSGGIYRASKDATGPSGARISDATSVTGLAVDDTYIYWLDGTGLWRADKTCTNSTCWNVKMQLAAAGGEYLTWKDEDELLWTSHSGGYWRIYRERLGVLGDFVLYSASDTSTYGIGRPAYHDDCYFWPENTTSIIIGGSVNNLVRRKCIASVETIAEGLTIRNDLFAGSLGLLFADGSGIYSLPFDAAAITKDLTLDNWEVTQGIQNLNNEVQLVAEKTTYVRVFGTISATRRADAVQVHLRGWRGGYEMADSPLIPVDGPRPLSPGDAWDRSNGGDSWLFQLPKSWTQDGILHLEAEIDPSGVYDDQNQGDNTLTGDFTFHYRPPACIVFMPVRTHAGKGSTSNPNFGHMLDRHKRLWPVPEVRYWTQSEPVEELEVCWKWGFIPYPCYGPYELWEDTWWELSDINKVMTSVGARWAFSDDPDVCDDAGAVVHYIGMVHPDSDTDGVNGTGSLVSPVAWVKFAPHDENLPYANSWRWPRAGGTLAHEGGHNHGREHINCGSPDPDTLDSGYPYADECTLDDRGLTLPETHYGFDINTRSPIRPDSTAADLMSYGNPNRWTSDYTWKALFSRVDDGGRLSVSDEPIAALASSQTNLASGNSVVVASGVLTPSTNQGRLAYSWVYPTATLSSGVLQKWQTLAVPSIRQVAAPSSAQYSLRLRAADGTVLDDRVFTPAEHYDEPSPRTASFFLTFPAPITPVAQIDLMIYSTVADSMRPGASTPSVQILQPAGGETFDDEMTVVWQASDVDYDDNLLYNVQYSPDLGQTWRALVTNWPGPFDSDTMTLTLSSLLGVPGSTTGGLVRVAASDGYNTGLATSNSFKVSNQPPVPYIVSPAQDQLFDAGEVVMLRGSASDTEDGGVSDADLSWEVTGQSVVTGSDVVMAGLAPGDYNVALTAQDSDGLAATTQVSLSVSPLAIASRNWTTDALKLDGFCDEDFYTTYGTGVPLKPYPDGGQAMARLIHTDGYLWACFSGMTRGITEPLPGVPYVSFAGLVIDADYSREHAVQAGDTWFHVQEDGTPGVWAGPGWGSGDPSSLLTRISANENAWNAELRIDASAIGGWDHVIGLELVHVWIHEGGGGHYAWPYKAATQYPDTWATAILGKSPQIEELAPNEATAGDSGALIAIDGKNFEIGAEALWDGKAITTTRIGSTLLLALVGASDLTTAGTVEVTAQNPGFEDTPSNGLTFWIKNPTPSITTTTPGAKTAGDPAFTLIVDGDDFVNGASVLWNGDPRPTTFVGSNQLSAQISADDIATVREIGVSVLNPEPSGGRSDVVTFTLLAPANHAPQTPFNPDPADGASGILAGQSLGWQGGDPDGQPVRYDVAFGTSNPPPLVESNLTTASYDPGALAGSTTYYWTITATDGLSITVGPTWNFTTEAFESVFLPLILRQ